MSTVASPPRILFCAMLVVFVAWPQLAHAQAAKTIFPQVSGQVHDAAGKPIGGANVELKAHETIKTRTDASGHFSIANVPPATYAIFVTAKGYKDAVLAGVIVQNEDVSLDVVLAAETALKQIASVAVGAGSSINVTGAPSHSLTPQDMEEQGQTEWRKILEELPGVSITTPSGQIVSVPGTPSNSEVVSLRGALPYETALLIDNMPMYATTNGLYRGNGVDLAAYNPMAFSSFDVVAGPGAQSPTILGSIGGSLNLHPAGQVNGNHYDFSIGMDPYGGWISNSMVQLRTGNLSATLTYGFDNSPGPIYQIPLYVDGSQIYKINGQSFSCGATCALNPTYPKGTSGPFFSGQQGGFVACCVTNPFSSWTTHNGSISLFYRVAPTVTAQFFMASNSGDTSPPEGWVPTLFTPPAGYSGAVQANSTLLMGPAGVTYGSAPGLTNSQIYEGKLTFQLGAGQLQLAMLSNISDTFNYVVDPPGDSYGNLKLYGGGAFYTDPGVSTATTPVVFNGQTASVTIFPQSYTGMIRGINHDYSANYTIPLGSDARAIASFVHSYFGYQDPLTIVYGLPNGTGGVLPLTESTTAADNYQETNQLRVGFGVTPNDHLSIDASFYMTGTNWQVANPNDPTQSSYIKFDQYYDAPRASLVWRPKPDIAVRAAAGGGLAIAPLGDLVGDNGQTTCLPNVGYCDQTLVNTAIRPETSFGYDLGVDKRLGGGTVLSSDIYLTNLWGQIYYNQSTSPPCPSCGGLPLLTTSYRNLAQTRYEGLEVDLHHDVPHGYYWNAALSLMRGFVLNLPPGFYNSGGVCNLSTGVNCASYAASVVPGINFNASFTGATVPYAQGFALFGYRWRPYRFVSVDMHYFGNNNGYYAPAFDVFDMNGGIDLNQNLAIQATFRNITNQDSATVQNWSTGVRYPTAFGLPTYYQTVPYGPRTFLLTFRIHG